MSVIKSLKKFCYEHKMLFATVLFILIYEFFFVSQGELFQTDSVTYAYHSVDFSMGFCTKILPGAIYNALVGVYTTTAVNIYVNILFLIFLCILAYCVERFFKNTPKEFSFECSVLIFLFLTGPFTFEIFIKELGMLDFYWILFFAIGYLLINHKYLKWLTPILIFAIILVHYSSVISYVSALLLIILFMSANAQNKQDKKSYLILFIISLTLTIIATLYFLFFEYSNLTFSMDEFNNILTNKKNAEDLRYYDFSFYRYVPESNEEISSLNIDISSLGFAGFIENIIYQIKVTLTLGKRDFWYIYILAAVMLAFLDYILISYIRKTVCKLKKFIVSLMIILYFFITSIGLFFSTDITRFLAHAFIILFIFVLTIIYYDYDAAFEKIKKLFSFIGTPCIILFCFIYSMTIVDVYL